MDYKKAYFILFNAITSAIYEHEKIIDNLKKAHQKTENMYIEHEEKLIIFRDPNHDCE